ncbi:hypothetical protein T492DRAFT_901146 [Pavlovales sp. CCMP2436]|nr:hypothetical protein T492DRAFT_901146 [Pavlovales sp. CCMP2436]
MVGLAAATAAECPEVCARHFEAALRAFQPSLSAHDLVRYEEHAAARTGGGRSGRPSSAAAGTRVTLSDVAEAEDSEASEDADELPMRYKEDPVSQNKWEPYAHFVWRDLHDAAEEIKKRATGVPHIIDSEDDE